MFKDTVKSCILDGEMIMWDVVGKRFVSMGENSNQVSTSSDLFQLQLQRFSLFLSRFFFGGHPSFFFLFLVRTF
jgi:hypothetical protein